MIPFNLKTLVEALHDVSRRALARALLRLLRWLNPRAAGWVLAFIRDEEL